jgi:hypothetical protein
MKSYKVVEKRGANHGLHLVLTILTGGLWALTGWPIAAMMGRKHKTRVPAGLVEQPGFRPPRY